MNGWVQYQEDRTGSSRDARMADKLKRNEVIADRLKGLWRLDRSGGKRKA